MYSAVFGRVFVGLPIPVHAESLCLGPSYSRCPAFRLDFLTDQSHQSTSPSAFREPNPLLSAVRWLCASLIYHGYDLLIFLLPSSVHPTLHMGRSTRSLSMPTMMNMIPPKAIAFSAAAVIAIFLLFNIAYKSPSLPAASSSAWWRKAGAQDAISATQNNTLGVSHAFSKQNYPYTLRVLAGKSI